MAQNQQGGRGPEDNMQDDARRAGRQAQGADTPQAGRDPSDAEEETGQDQERAGQQNARPDANNTGN